MTSRKRKALPPWLQGVTVKKEDKVTIEEDKPSYCVKNTVSETNGTANTGKKEPSSASDRDHKTCDQLLDPVTALGMTYDEYTFTGSIIYSHTNADTNIICEELIQRLEESQDTKIVGFDTEWPVTYTKGSQAKTALVQVCVDDQKCYLFHVSCMPKFPAMLKKLIEMDNVKKVGLSIEGDIWKLGKDYDIRAKDIVQNSIIELKTLANKKLRSLENWSLEGLTKNTLRLRISKDPDVRKCDWSQFPLPRNQQLYAATDAAVSLKIYNKLNSMK